MATKKIATKITDGNGMNGAQGAVDGAAGMSGGTRPAGTAGAVWDALTGNPGGTVARFAAEAGVSRATVTRTLTALEAGGRAVRTRGGWDGGKRQPDTWHATDTTGTGDGDANAEGADGGAVTGDTDAGEADAAPTGHATGAAADASQGAVSRPVDASSSATGDVGTGDAGTGADQDADCTEGAGLDPVAVAEARDALTALRDGIATALEALEAGDGDGALSAAEGAYSGSGLVRRLVRTAARGPVRTASGQARSQPGAMRAKVAAHLSAHAGSEFTPHEVAKVIGHSAGAVSNALDRLVEAGAAELVCERPRRFTTARPAPAAPSAAH